MQAVGLRESESERLYFIFKRETDRENKLYKGNDRVGSREKESTCK